MPSQEDYCPECDVRQIPGEEEHLKNCSRKNLPRAAKETLHIDDGLTVSRLLDYLAKNGPTQTGVLNQEVDGSVSVGLSLLRGQGRVVQPRRGIWMLPGDERYKAPKAGDIIAVPKGAKPPNLIIPPKPDTSPSKSITFHIDAAIECLNLDIEKLYEAIEVLERIKARHV